VSSIEEAALECIARHPDVEVVVLFGSTAAGHRRPESDVDLYLRLRPGSTSTSSRRRA
jgi:predicted nucleotidyltransferase